jgi:ubiquinone/menaquinone biosynthesis C-methylase UbiE
MEATFMSLMETEETNQFPFASFAAHPFYTHINRSLVQQALASTTRPTGAKLTIVDMACGTGAITQLIAEEIALQRRQARILGVDPSAEALRLAQRKMEGSGAPAEFIQGEADDLPHFVHHADAVFFCNAMHLLADKLVAFRHMAALLAPGGIFACNSAFYKGANVEETVRFSRLWIRRAVGWLRKEHPEVHLSREATAMQWLPPEAYVSLLKQSGFGRIDVSQEKVMLSLDGLRDLGHYWLFIEGALPGAPLSLGAAALGAAAYQAGQELGLTEVPRMWLQIIATKGSSTLNWS